MKRKRLLIGVSAIALVAAGATFYAAPLTADPVGPKDCVGILPNLTPVASTPAQVPELNWAQRGGTVNDASCLNRTAVAGVVAVRDEADVALALAYGRAHRLPVSAAGVKHSMGGQALRVGGLVLDMRGLNAIRLDPEHQVVTVGSGATWHDIQNAIHPRFAVKAMQSTDIFTVGGSIAVNAHGMDHRAGALMNSIRSMRVMLADGSVVTASRTENANLFRHVVGGYGLFGIVLSAELDVVPNDVLRSERRLIASGDFPSVFAALERDPAVRLTYTHLSTAPGSLLQEGLVYAYRRDPGDQNLPRAPLTEIASTKLRRLTVNLSKRNDFFRGVKWWAEKNLEHRFETCTISRAQAMGDGEACLVSRNDPMHDNVPYLRDALPNETDILHEYFLPRDRLLPFIAELKRVLADQHVNLVNASIRAVGAEDNALSYAPTPAFSVVLYINQATDDEGTRRMARLTSDLIDLCVKQGGRFFLPYQLHYSPEQLRASYPEIGIFFAEKRRWDPDGLFSNSWYARFAPSFS